MTRQCVNMRVRDLGVYCACLCAHAFNKSRNARSERSASTATNHARPNSGATATTAANHARSNSSAVDVAAARSVVRGAWCVVCGAWCVVRSAWCVVRGSPTAVRTVLLPRIGLRLWRQHRRRSRRPPIACHYAARENPAYTVMSLYLLVVRRHGA